MPLFPGSAKLCGHGSYGEQEPIIIHVWTHWASFALVPASRAAMLVGAMPLRQMAPRKMFTFQQKLPGAVCFLLGWSLANLSYTRLIESTIESCFRP